jgi:AraC family transcriptional regulator
MHWFLIFHILFSTGRGGAQVEIRVYYYSSGGMEQFRYPEATYVGWAILAAQTGRFSFAIHDPESTDGTVAAAFSGEAEFGEIVLCPPGSVLKRSMLEPTTFHFIELSGELALTPGKVRIRDVQRLSSTCAYLIRLRAEQSYDNQAEIDHLISDLLFLAQREQTSATASQRETTDPLMHHIAALLERQACDPDFSLQHIAGQSGLRASQLSTRFQAAYSMSPIQFATSVRMAKASKLLVETDLTLDAVAERCGYQNAFYFSRVFSKYMKINPSIFRRTNSV